MFKYCFSWLITGVLGTVTVDLVNSFFKHSLKNDVMRNLVVVPLAVLTSFVMAYLITAAKKKRFRGIIME